jgi:hypothetical protein
MSRKVFSFNGNEAFMDVCLISSLFHLLSESSRSGFSALSRLTRGFAHYTAGSKRKPVSWAFIQDRKVFS